MRIARSVWSRALLSAWWNPALPLPWAGVLLALSRLYAVLWRRSQRQAVGAALRTPVLVVGNVVVGGAGKTPTVLALARALVKCGWKVGVVSKGYGSRAAQSLRPRPVRTTDAAIDVGDEPLMLARALADLPVWVGRDRHAVAQLMLQQHPELTLVLSDDGLQHKALPRQAQVLVFDERGVGNGRLLPAGPMRQPWPETLPTQTWVVYNAPAPSTPWPGVVASRRLMPPRRLGADPSSDLANWADWRGREVVAVAGVGHPERFFGMLRDLGLRVHPCPLPDHAPLHVMTDLAPWQGQDLPVLMTEKDAVKLSAQELQDNPWRDRLWVVGLDFFLPDTLIQALNQALLQTSDQALTPSHASPATPTTAPPS